MSLDPLPDWTAAFEAMPLAATTAEGAQNFVSTLVGLQDKVQAGATGSPGILTTNAAPMIAAMSAMQPTAGTEWVDTVADAWQATLTASTIAPGTAVNAAWTLSVVDTLTLPAAATTITTLAAAVATLKSGLNAAASAGPAAGPEKIAKAFRDAVLEFKFNCIGLAAGVPPIPTPVLLSAQ